MKAGGPAWPNLFVIGAAKCGTTSLHSTLGRHSQVHMSAVKEPHYFAANLHATIRRPSAYDYLSEFRANGGAKFLGEASPSYLWDQEAPTRIYESLPDPAEARFLVLLRDPVERAHSHYLMDVREGQQQASFAEAVALDDLMAPRLWGGPCHLYRDLGQYGSQLNHWLKTWPIDQFLLVETDHIANDAPAALRRIAAFLGLSMEEAWMQPVERKNSYQRPRRLVPSRLLGSDRLRSLSRRAVPRGVRHKVRDRILMVADERPAITPALRVELQSFYRSEIEQLRRTSGLELPTLTSRWGPVITEH